MLYWLDSFLSYLFRFTKDHIKNAKNLNDEGKAFRHVVDSGNAGVPAQEQRSLPTGRAVTQRLDLTVAKRYAPPDVMLYHETTQDGIKGLLGRGRGRSHSCSMAYGLDVALRVVLVWCWDRHLERNPGQTCPFDFPFTLPTP